MYYVRFIEKNEWEGETWTFYIPLYGNEDALRILAHLVKDNPGTAKAYRVAYEPLTEAEVEFRCRSLNESEGYMSRHNRLAGHLDLARLPGVTPQHLTGALAHPGLFCVPDILEQDVFQALYKGKIANLMVT